MGGYGEEDRDEGFEVDVFFFLFFLFSCLFVRTRPKIPESFVAVNVFRIESDQFSCETRHYVSVAPLQLTMLRYIKNTINNTIISCFVLVVKVNRE